MEFGDQYLRAHLYTMTMSAALAILWSVGMLCIREEIPVDERQKAADRDELFSLTSNLMLFSVGQPVTPPPPKNPWKVNDETNKKTSSELTGTGNETMDTGNPSLPSGPNNGAPPSDAATDRPTGSNAENSSHHLDEEQLLKNQRDALQRQWDEEDPPPGHATS